MRYTTVDPKAPWGKQLKQHRRDIAIERKYTESELRDLAEGLCNEAEREEVESLASHSEGRIY